MKTKLAHLSLKPLDTVRTQTTSEQPVIHSNIILGSLCWSSSSAELFLVLRTLRSFLLI
jgi:hypothetical protein